MTASGRPSTSGDPKGHAPTTTPSRALATFRKAQRTVQQMNQDAKARRDDDREDGTLWALD